MKRRLSIARACISGGLLGRGRMGNTSAMPYTKVAGEFRQVLYAVKLGGVCRVVFVPDLGQGRASVSPLSRCGAALGVMAGGSLAGKLMSDISSSARSSNRSESSRTVRLANA